MARLVCQYDARSMTSDVISLNSLFLDYLRIVLCKHSQQKAERDKQAGEAEVLQEAAAAGWLRTAAAIAVLVVVVDEEVAAHQLFDAHPFLDLLLEIPQVFLVLFNGILGLLLWLGRWWRWCCSWTHIYWSCCFCRRPCTILPPHLLLFLSRHLITLRTHQLPFGFDIRLALHFFLLVVFL